MSDVKTACFCNNEYYCFDGFPPKKQKRIIELLSYCKEIRNTAYPMNGSKVTELKIVDFHAHKEKNLVYISGSLSLTDGQLHENRTMEAYIFDAKDQATVYLDITRVSVSDEPKMIRTSENFVEEENTIIAITKYCGGECFEDKMYTEEFLRNTKTIPDCIIDYEQCIL